MRVIAFILTILVLTGCIRARTIPDETLADIFCDMYIANAYVDENIADFGGSRSVVGGYASNKASVEIGAMDSINIYEPILRNYGYRTRDFVYTLTTFSKRKSSKVGDVIDKAIEKLDAKIELYSAQLSVIEQLDSVAYANTADTVLVGKNMSARTIADTAKMKILYEATDGHYRIEYSYMLDTLDKNFGLRATHYLRDSVGMVVGQNSFVMLRGTRARRIVELMSSEKLRS
jgi:hypothetical protein